MATPAPRPDRGEDRARSRWTGAVLTHRGLVREANEDAALVLNELGLWIVADGMGGHPGGDVASRLAVEATADYVRRHAAHCGEAKKLLLQAIRYANERVRGEVRIRPELETMGTTIVALHVGEAPEADATLVHVGDSRAYLVRDGSLQPLTTDHSYVEERIREGLLTREEARRHPYRHMLSRAVGIEPEVEPDVRSFALRPGDRILLCTDGLTKMIEDEEILALLGTAASQEEACRLLVEAANRRGGADNTTVVVVGAVPQAG
jgi:protein phosphatase